MAEPALVEVQQERAAAAMLTIGIVATTAGSLLLCLLCLPGLLMSFGGACAYDPGGEQGCLVTGYAGLGLCVGALLLPAALGAWGYRRRRGVEAAAFGLLGCVLYYLVAAGWLLGPVG